MNLSTTPLNNTRAGRQTAILVVLILFLAACASSTLFISYPLQIRPFKTAINQGDLSSPPNALRKKASGKNKALYLMESGRISQLNQAFESSQSDFESVIASFRARDDEATITAKGSGAFLTSLISNDNALPYRVEAYERIFVHQFQSINYLAQNDLEGALVEIRRAKEEQTFALEAHHKELAKAQKESKKENMSFNENEYADRFSVVNNAASKVKSSFQNAYTFYYSAVIQEASGDLNDAYIDYKKALDIFPNNPYLQSDVLRLSQSLSMTDDYNQFKHFKQKANKLQGDQGTLVILYEEGFVPEKAEIFIPLQTLYRIHSFALPTYLVPWQANLPLQIKDGDKYLGKTNLIVDVHALGAKALQEKTFSRIVRQALRVNTKARLQRKAEEEGGALGGLVGSIYSVVSEKADLRSFLTLPQNAQISRFNLTNGSHSIQLNNARLSDSVQINIKKGKITLLRVVNTGGNSFHTETFYL